MISDLKMALINSANNMSKKGYCPADIRKNLCLCNYVKSEYCSEVKSNCWMKFFLGSKVDSRKEKPSAQNGGGKNQLTK